MPGVKPTSVVVAVTVREKKLGPVICTVALAPVGKPVIASARAPVLSVYWTGRRAVSPDTSVVSRDVGDGV